MAEASRSLDNFLLCPICFEEFEENGDRVPRILPCHHTFCHSYVGKMIQNNTIECPEDRRKHHAPDQQKTFPQNKYILAMVRMKKIMVKPETLRKCEEHGKELILFCKEMKCKKSICLKCLTRRHLGNKVVEIEEMEKEEKDALIAKLDDLEQMLERNKTITGKAGLAPMRGSKQCRMDILPADQPCESAASPNTSCRFPSLSTTDVDKIASNTVKPNTWGINVFKGKYSNNDIEFFILSHDTNILN